MFETLNKIKLLKCILKFKNKCISVGHVIFLTAGHCILFVAGLLLVAGLGQNLGTGPLADLLLIFRAVGFKELGDMLGLILYRMLYGIPPIHGIQPNVAVLASGFRSVL